MRCCRVVPGYTAFGVRRTWRTPTNLSVTSIHTHLEEANFYVIFFLLSTNEALAHVSLCRFGIHDAARMLSRTQGMKRFHASHHCILDERLEGYQWLEHFELHREIDLSVTSICHLGPGRKYRGQLYGPNKIYKAKLYARLFIELRVVHKGQQATEVCHGPWDWRCGEGDVGWPWRTSRQHCGLPGTCRRKPARFCLTDCRGTPWAGSVSL